MAITDTFRAAGQAWASKARSKVRGYTRTDGTRVRSHERVYTPRTPQQQAAHDQLVARWRTAKVATGSAAVSGLTTAVLILETGFALVTTLCLLLTAALGAVSVWASAKAGESQRTTRSATRSRASTSHRKPPPRKRSTGTRSSGTRQRARR